MSIPAMRAAARSDGSRWRKSARADWLADTVLPSRQSNHDKRLDMAINGLERAEPQFSARTIPSGGQCAALTGLFIVLALGLLAGSHVFAMTCVVALSMSFAANALFRGWLVWVGSHRDAAAEPPCVPDCDLPIYSILVPLYHEANMVPRLLQALGAIDYPAHLIDVKLIVEADDRETIAAIEARAHDKRFEVIHVPPAEPRTKPKACNYALPDVRGEFVVIYDAEDRPEPDQLRKAVATFRASRHSVACLQARLNFFNSHRGWLPKMFTLDYSLWFDLLLPGLDRANIPMPLGGTSNHFRVGALRAIHGWDPFNVTEDADIGIRLARLGYRVRTLDSTTFEEAPDRFGVWLKQRTRWLKGYMQTWLVHMRDPAQLLRNAGVAGFIGFQLFIGGTVASALINPVLWLIFALSRIMPIPALEGIDAHVSLAGLVFGNGLFAYLSMLGPLRRGWLELSPLGIFTPIYWLMISLAGYRALIQLFRNASHWEKTPHGLSHFDPGDVA